MKTKKSFLSAMLVGLLALSFVFVSCGDDEKADPTSPGGGGGGGGGGGATLTFVNNYAEAVKIDVTDQQTYYATKEPIAAGAKKTWDITVDKTFKFSDIYWYVWKDETNQFDNSHPSYFEFEGKEQITITLSAAGKVSVSAPE
jgi:hypothetical protein